MNPYSKSTKGYNAEVIVAKQLAYTSQATVTLFADNAAEGEVGVYNAETNALITNAAGAPTGTVVYIMQKRDGAIHKTSPFKTSPGFATYTDYTPGALNTWVVTATGLAVAKGDVLEVAFIELTTAAQPYHPTNFDVTVKAGESLTQALARLAAKISDKNAPEWSAYGQLATATVNAGVLTVVAKDSDRYFKLIVRNALGDVTIAQTVAPATGSGSAAGIAAIEAEGAIFDGVTTNYPLVGNPDEYGQATKFATAGVNYDVLMLKPWREEASPMPFHKHVHKSYIFVAVPTTGASPKATLKSIFGFTAPAA
jgi:hypothetical protein